MRTIVIASLMAIAASGTSRAAEPLRLPYALPKTRVAVAIAQTLVHCPPSAQEQADRGTGDNRAIEFVFAPGITPKSLPDRLVLLDVHGGALVDRSSKLQYNEDGVTLKQFNGTATGQGGTLLASVIKAGTSIYGLAADPFVAPRTLQTGSSAIRIPNLDLRPASPRTRNVTRHYLQCRLPVARAAERYDVVAGQIAVLEGKMISGTIDAASTALLAKLRAELASLSGELTIIVKASSPIDPTLSPSGASQSLDFVLPPPLYARWFEVVEVTRQVRVGTKQKPDQPATLSGALQILGTRFDATGEHRAPVVGFFGYDVRVKLDKQTLAWFSCGAKGTPRCSADDVAPAPLETRDFAYRRAIAATISIAPRDRACIAICPDADETAGKPIWLGADQATASTQVRFPQLSRLFRLPAKGSIFGSHTVAATFDANGMPTAVEYTVGSAAKDISGILDAGVAGAQTVNGARLAATKAELDEITSSKALQDALDKQLDESQ